MDICTKVTLRQRLLPSGKITLYLDYYPAIRNPKTNRSQRHEYMGIYLYGNPTNQVQRKFNNTMLEKAELIRCRRQEQVINRQFGFIDHTQQREDFLSYFEGVCKKRYEKWKIVFMHFRKFTGGKCTFGDVTVDLCTRFREYLLTAKQLKHTEKTVSRNTASGYFSTFRALLKQAYKERLITENINDYLEYIEWEDVVREFLTQEELIQLAQTPCKHDVLRRASLFSCLTGLRISDIENLHWDNIQPVTGIGLCIVITIQKTKTPVKLPLCDEAVELSMYHKDIGTTMRYIHEVSTAIEATLSEDDRQRLDDNFKSWTDGYTHPHLRSSWLDCRHLHNGQYSRIALRIRNKA